MSLVEKFKTYKNNRVPIPDLFDANNNQGISIKEIFPSSEDKNFILFYNFGTWMDTGSFSSYDCLENIEQRFIKVDRQGNKIGEPITVNQSNNEHLELFLIKDKFILVDSKVIKRINKNFQIEKEININNICEEGVITASQKLLNGNLIIAMKKFFYILNNNFEIVSKIPKEEKIQVRNIYELKDGRFFVHGGDEIPYDYEVDGVTFNSYRTNDKFYLFNNAGLEKSIFNAENRNPLYSKDSFAENNGKIYYTLYFNVECHIINLHNFQLEKKIEENYVGSLSFYNYGGKLYYSDCEELPPNEFPGFIYLEEKGISKLFIRDNVIVIIESIPNGRVSENEFYFADL